MICNFGACVYTAVMKKQYNKKKAPQHISAHDIAKAVSQWPIVIPQDVHTPLATYLTLLMQWNRVMNLVGARHWQDCLHGLLVDSFHLNNFLRDLCQDDTTTTKETSATKTAPPNTHQEGHNEQHPLQNIAQTSKVEPSTIQQAQIWDLGAGAGLPGIPLRMVWHDGEYHLIEVREKRALFLSTVLAQLQSTQSPLPHTHVFRGRVEEFFDQQIAAGKYANIIVSRAFMPWAEVLELVKGVLAVPEKSDTLSVASDTGIATKARVVFLTLESAPTTALTERGWMLEREYSYQVQGQNRYFWSVQRA